MDAPTSTDGTDDHRCGRPVHPPGLHPVAGAGPWSDMHERRRTSTRRRGLVRALVAVCAVAGLFAGPVAAAGATVRDRVTGTVSELIVDGAGGHSSGGLRLVDGDRIWSLVGPGAAAAWQFVGTGASVEVVGVADRQRSEFRVEQVHARVGVASAPTTTGTRSVLVLKLTVPGHRDLRDRDGRVISSTALRTTMTDVAEFYAAASSNKLTLTHQVLDPVLALGSDSDADRCWRYEKFQPEADKAARGRGVEPNSFSHVLYVLPVSMLTGCTEAQGRFGLAAALGPGRLVWTYGWISQNTIAHELGHNLGSPHSATLRCVGTGGVSVALSADCNNADDGRFWAGEDVLGAGRFTHNGHHRSLYGWVTPKPVTASGSHLLAPLGAPAPGAAEVLQVRRRDGSFFYLDIRRAGGTPPVSTNAVAAAAGPPVGGGSLHESGHTGCCCPDCAVATVPGPTTAPAAAPVQVAELGPGAPAASSTSRWLAAGAALRTGESRQSSDGTHRLEMQTDGNLVVRRVSDNSARWSSNTAGNPGARAVMQTDGSLVVYRADNTVAWSSGTQATGAAWALMSSTGELRLTLPESHGYRVVWSSASGLTGNTLSALGAGQGMSAGGQVTSPDGTHRLVMQSDGNLVIYRTNNTAVWAIWNTKTFGNPGAYMYVQAGGNIVVWSTGSVTPQRQLYASPGSNMGVTRMSLGNDGVLRLELADGRAVWSSTGGLTGNSASALAAGTTLGSGAQLRSPDGNVTAVMQTDGNLVVRSAASNTVLWSSNTAGNPGARLVMQTDGNLVIYRTNNTAVWASRTMGTGALASVDDDGQFLVTTSGWVSFSTGEPLVADPPAGPFTRGVSIRLAAGHTDNTRAALVDTTPGSAGGFTDAPLVAGSTFQDPAGQVTIRHDGFDATGNARLTITAPSAAGPSGVARVTTVERGGDNITVGFTSAIPDASVARYELGRTRSATSTADVAVVASGNSSVRSLSELNRAEGAWYYRVRAVGTNNLPGAWSGPTGAVAVDWTAPSVPGDLKARKEGDRMVLTWTPSTDVGRGVRFYRVYRNGELVANADGAGAKEAVVAAGGANSRYEVEAVDLSGNVSARASVVK